MSIVFYECLKMLETFFPLGCKCIPNKAKRIEPRFTFIR